MKPLLLTACLIAAACSGVAGQSYKKGVVRIVSAFGHEINEETGSGIIVGNDDTRIFVLTARHVVINEDGEVAQNIQVELAKELTSRPPFTARPPENVNQALDFAVIEVNVGSTENLKFFRFTKNKNVRLRDNGDARSVGHVMGGKWVTLDVKVKKNTLSFNEFEVVSTLIQGGSSGGPVLSKGGKNIKGMITRTTPGATAQAVDFDVIEYTFQQWGIPDNLIGKPIPTTTYILGGLSLVSAGTGYFIFNQEMADLNDIYQDFRDPAALEAKQGYESREALKDDILEQKDLRNGAYIGAGLLAAGSAATAINWKRVCGEKRASKTLSPAPPQRDFFDRTSGAHFFQDGSGIGIKINF